MKQNKVYTINIQPNNSRTIDNSLLNVSGTLNGIPTIFTLDTAASTCILSEKFAKENNLEILESDTKVKVANNDVVKVLGRTSKLKIEVKNHTCDLEMFVLPHNEFECLLGLQWFLATGCSVNPSERTLQFKSANFSIDYNDDSFDDHEEHAFLTDTDTAELEDMDFFENLGSQGAPPVSTTPVANLPPVSMTPVANCRRYQRHRRQILPPVPLVLLTPVANNGNNIRLQIP